MESPQQGVKGKGLFGLSLAGGGLKSFSQLAVLHDLEKHQVKIDAVAGTSMGSVVAALVANGLTASEIEETLLDAEREFAERGVFSRPAYLLVQHVREHNNGFVELQNLQQMACQLFEKIGCRDAFRMPFASRNHGRRHPHRRIDYLHQQARIFHEPNRRLAHLSAGYRIGSRRSGVLCVSDDLSPPRKSTGDSWSMAG